MRTYEEILRDVARSCDSVLYRGYKDNYAEVIESATKIYIAELQKEKDRGLMLDEDGFPTT